MNNEIQNDSPFTQNDFSPTSFEISTSEFNSFARWCVDFGVPFLPADPVALELYIEEVVSKNYSPTTIQHLKGSIHKAHVVRGLPSPVKDPEVAASIEAALSKARNHNREVDEVGLYAVVGDLPDDLTGTRDRALLLLKAHGDLSYEEVALLDTNNVGFTDDGLVVQARRFEKPSREIEVRISPNPDVCPVRALLAWLELSGIKNGPIFRPLQGGVVQPSRLDKSAVGHIIHRRTEAAGEELAKVLGKPTRGLSGHKLSQIQTELANLREVAESAERREQELLGELISAEERNESLQARLARAEAELAEARKVACVRG